jgi:hypothetical protein
MSKIWLNDELRNKIHFASGDVDDVERGISHQSKGNAGRDSPFYSASYVSFVVARFLLEVLGAAGAVWGSSEILFLRDTPGSNMIMRHIALGIGGIFFIRFYWDAKHCWNHQRCDYLPIKLHHRRIHMLPYVTLSVFAVLRA